MDNGRLFKTTNGGINWTQQNAAFVPFSSYKLKFVTDQTGYSLSGGSIVHKTTDGGKFWEQIPGTNSDYSLEDLFAYSADQLWAGGQHGYLEMTTNGGGNILKPRAYFHIDTSNYFATRTINLVNDSKTGSTYQWFKNDTLIGSGYH